MIGELLAYGFALFASPVVWAYQLLADRVRCWRHDDIRADQIIWWVQDHLRGSADSTSVETQPAADSSDSESAAGPNDRADSHQEVQPNPDRNKTRWTKQWARKKRAKTTATSRTVGNTLDGTATRSKTRSSTTTDFRADSSRQTATARTDPATGVLGRSPVAGHNVPASALPHAAAGTDPAVEVPPELDRGPKPPVDAADPRHGVDWCTNPGDPGGADAVVPEPAASARSAA